MVTADPRDPHAALVGLRATGLPLAGVLTYDEFCLPSAAAVAAELGLRHTSPTAAQRCRDKRLMREAFAAAGVASPVSIAASTLIEVEAAADRTGYPLVIKPVALAGSIGVILVRDPSELGEAYRQCRTSGRPEYGAASEAVLVEEYIDGPEISIESLVTAGAVETVALTRKFLVPPPYFEERGHVVVAGAPDPALATLASRAQEALGVTWGATHTEIRRGRSGPKVIEVAARPAGDLIPLLVRLATGVDLTVSSAAALIGEPAPPARTPAAPAAAVRFFFPNKEMVFGSAFSEVARAAPPWLHSFVVEAAPGDILRLPPYGYLNRIGYAVVTGDDETVCQQRLDSIEDSIQVSGEPFHN